MKDLNYLDSNTKFSLLGKANSTIKGGINGLSAFYFKLAEEKL